MAISLFKPYNVKQGLNTLKVYCTVDDLHDLLKNFLD